MARVTTKDGAEAVAMLDSKKPARKRTPARKPAAKAVQPAPKESEASLVRTLLDEGRTIKEIASALKDNGVTWTTSHHSAYFIDRV